MIGAAFTLHFSAAAPADNLTSQNVFCGLPFWGEVKCSGLKRLLLSQYLGHKNIYATQSYLQFTADMFPYVTETVQNALGSVIPGMEEDDEETHWFYQVDDFLLLSRKR